MIVLKKLRNIIAVTLIAGVLLTGTVAASAAEFGDISGHWGEDAILTWGNYGVVSGYPDGTYQPDGSITRAEVAQVLVNLLRIQTDPSTNPFSDVTPDDWFYTAALRCWASGYISGFEDGTFRGSANITREQTMVMIARALQIQQSTTSIISFPDSGEISGWARGFIFGLVNAGIVTGYDTGLLQPLRNITRAEVAAILRKAISTYAYEEGETYVATGSGIVLVVANNVTIKGPVATLLVGDGALGGEVHLSDAQVDEIKLVSEDVIVYVSEDSTVDTDSITVGGEPVDLEGDGVGSDSVVFEDDTPSGDIIDPPPEDDVPAGPVTPPVTPPRPGSRPTPTTTTYTVRLGIRETTTGELPREVPAITESNYVASTVPLALIYAQLIIEEGIVGYFRDEFQDTYANEILLEGMAAYVAGVDAWTVYVDKYIEDVEETRGALTVTESIKMALRNRATIGDVGTGTWWMTYNVEQGAGSGHYRTYTVEIAIS